MRFLQSQRWWIGRTLMLPVHLLIFTIITFAVIRMVPGDPVRAFLGPTYTQADYDQMQAALGLDGTVLAQLRRYLTGLLTGDLGTSLTTGRPVWEDFQARVPATVELALIAMTLTVVVSVLASHFAVVRPRAALARIIRGYAKSAGSVPEYVLAIVALYLFYATLHWAPAPLGLLDTDLVKPVPHTYMPLLDTVIGGYWDATWSMVRHLVLPVGVLVVGNSAILIKILVASVEDEAQAAPTIFRIAVGNRRRTVLASVYRRAAPAAIVMAGTILGYILGGAVVLEALFGLTGLGSYAVTAVNTSDYPAIQGVLLVVAAFLLVVYLLVDVVNMIIDPRRRPGAVQEV